MRDVNGQHGPHGWPVQAIWPKRADGTDIDPSAGQHREILL